MRLTTRGRFAVTAMIDLAMRSDRGPVKLSAISKRQQISLSYLEQLFGKLRRRNLVESIRGPGGGYTLGPGALGISVADIVTAVDEGDGATGGAGAQPSARREDCQCMTQDLWSGLDASMLEYLGSVSLKELVEDQIAKGVSAGEAPTKRPTSVRPVARPLRIKGPNSVFALGAWVSASSEDSPKRVTQPAQGRVPADTRRRG